MSEKAPKYLIVQRNERIHEQVSARDLIDTIPEILANMDAYRDDDEEVSDKIEVWKNVSPRKVNPRLVELATYYPEEEELVTFKIEDATEREDHLYRLVCEFNLGTITGSTLRGTRQ